jgi:hypothetical protein
MTTHQVKSWPEFFGPISHNMKPFDLRIDDRGYTVGDKVQFEEFRPGVGEYTGAVTQRRITFILRNFDGLMPGYCILGLVTMEDRTWNEFTSRRAGP